MTTKLVSANLGIRLTLEVDGVQKDVEWSAVCPSASFDTIEEMCQNMNDFLDETFGTTMITYDASDKVILIAKPKRIKARRPISQAEFNKRVAELGYDSVSKKV